MLNPDFSDGLNHWHAEGAVFSTGNQGVLTDDAVVRSFLYQAVEASAGPLAVSFDFRNLLSSVTGSGGVRDSFFATLYLTNTPLAFNLANATGFSSAIALFDLDSTGLSNVASGAVIGPSPLGGGFSRFSISIAPVGTSHLVAAFDLVDLNFVNDDSVVLLDNVSVQPAPEPGALALLALTGLLGMAGRRARRWTRR